VSPGNFPMERFYPRGRLNRNMRPAHATAAAVRGSLGVGVSISGAGGYRSVFDLYYDRLIKDVDDRLGHCSCIANIRNSILKNSPRDDRNNVF